MFFNQPGSDIAQDTISYGFFSFGLGFDIFPPHHSSHTQKEENLDENGMFVWVRICTTHSAAKIKTNSDDTKPEQKYTNTCMYIFFFNRFTILTYFV